MGISITLGLDDLTSGEAWRSALAEFIATFLFVFVGAGAVVSSFILLPGDATPAHLAVIALAHGLAIATLVAATARLSGGHINPAVSIGAVASGKMGIAKGGMYVAAQLAGAILGALLLKAVIPGALEGGLGAHALHPDLGAWAGLVIEIILTFVLVFTVFATAMDPRGPGHLAPFAIGLAILIDHLIGVPLTGASMNPARTLGPALAAGQWADHWVYWVGPIAGGVIAAVLYQAVFIGKSEGESA